MFIYILVNEFFEFVMKMKARAKEGKSLVDAV